MSTSDSATTVRVLPARFRAGLLVLSGPLVLGGLWYLVTEVLELFPGSVLPSPVAVMDIFMRVSDPIIQNLVPTVRAGLLGFVVALVTATALAVVVSISDRIREAIMPFVVGGNTMPRVAVAPLIVFYVDVLSLANLIIAAWIAFFPMFINITEGLEHVDEDRLRFFALVDATTWQRYRHLRFPTALPFVFDALKIGIIAALVGAVVGEFVAATEGIGYLALISLQNNNVPLAMAVVFAVGGVSTVLLFAIYVLEDRLMFWEDASIFTE